MASPSFQHRVALVCPGRDSLAWLAAVVRDAKGHDPWQPVTLVVPSPYLLAAVRQSLAEAGCANVRLRVQLRPIAERIARGCGSRAFDQPLTGPLEDAAIRVAIADSSHPDLRRLAENRALQESLAGLFREFGHLDATEPALAALEQGTSISAAAR